MGSSLILRQVKLEEGLMSSGRLNDALQSLLEWLNKAQAYLEQDQLLLGDLDSVSSLIEKHKLFQQEITSRKGIVTAMLSTPTTGSTELQGQLDELKKVWDQVKELSEVREVKLQESLKLAETFNDAIQVVRDWLPDAEIELKYHSIPDDEDSILQLIENHERFQEELESQQMNVAKVRKLAEEILTGCHPSAVRFVKYYFTITQTRWEQAVSRSNQRSIKLQEALKTTRDNTAMMIELMSWLNDGHALLLMKEKDDLPNDLTVIEALGKEHLEFHEELINKSKDIDRIVKSFTGGVTSSGTSPASGQSEKRAQSGRHAHLLKSSHANSDSLSSKATALQNKWKLVLKMSTERKKKLQDALSKILELENCRNFDFDVWRQSYIAWNRTNKLKFVDFFRRQDRHGTGLLTKKEFVEGIMASKFPTNETELLVVFNVFDVKRLGRIQYKTFVDAIMRPDKSIGYGRFDSKTSNDSQTIDREIEDRLSKCQCRNSFNAYKVDDGKYKFGEKDRVCTMRVMNGNVYVRFGSSWMPLDEFIDKNDPCKAKVKPASTPRSALKSSKAKSVSDLVNLNGKSPLPSSSRVQTPNNRFRKLNLTPTASQSNLMHPIKEREISALEKSRLALFSRSCVNLTSNPENPKTTPSTPDVPYLRNPAMGLSVYQSGSTPRYRKVHTGVNVNGRQSSASSSSSSSTSTWPRTESNPPGSLCNSVMSAPGAVSSRSQQSPTSTSTSPSATNLRPSRRTPGSHSTPSSTASSPSSRFPLKTFTTSRSPQRTPRSRPSTAGLTDDGTTKKTPELKRGRQSPSSSGLFLTSRTLNL